MTSETAVSQRKGDWQQTFTGRQFWPMDPRVEDICIEDIAHALSMQCRFAGHCRTFYSVAEHSVRVSWEVERNLREETGHDDKSIAGARLAALLHDASEAYCVDVPRPLKPYLTNYKEIESRVMRAIEEWAGLPLGVCETSIIKRADEVLLMTEARDLMSKPPVPWTWAQPVEPLEKRIDPWDQSSAEHYFLNTYRDLMRRIRG